MLFSIWPKRPFFDRLYHDRRCPTSGFGNRMTFSNNPEKLSLFGGGCNGSATFSELFRLVWRTINHASATQSSRAGWRYTYREGNSSFTGPTPQSLGVCAAFFCDQARSNWDSVTSATQFHCPKLYDRISYLLHALRSMSTQQSMRTRSKSRLELAIGPLARDRNRPFVRRKKQRKWSRSRGRRSCSAGLSFV